MNDTHGGRANIAGKQFENQFRSLLETYSYRALTPHEKKELREGVTPGAFEGKWYAQQLKVFKSIYGIPFNADFVFNAGGGYYIVEMKWQTTGGSVDEKYPFTILTHDKVAKEHGLTAVIVIAGSGARGPAVQWCVEQQNERLIVLQGGDELTKWFQKLQLKTN